RLDPRDRGRSRQRQGDDDRGAGLCRPVGGNSGSSRGNGHAAGAPRWRARALVIGLTRPPPTLSFWHPACLVSTWFGVGLLPLTPGTWGSIAALPFAWLIAWRFGPQMLLVAGALAFAIGVWAAGIYSQRSGIWDPGPVVIDEVAGQFVTLAFAPL